MVISILAIDSLASYIPEYHRIHYNMASKMATTIHNMFENSKNLEELKCVSLPQIIPYSKK